MNQQLSKELTVGMIAAGVSVATFFAWKSILPFLAEGQYDNAFRFIAPIAGLVLSGALFVLAGIFVRNRSAAYLCPALGIAVPFLFLPATSIVLGALGMSLLLISYAVHRMREEYEYSLGFSVSKVARAGLPVFFSVAALIVAIFYFSGLNEERAISAFAPRPVIQFFLVRMSGNDGLFSELPPIDAHMTVDDLIREIARRKLDSQGVPSSTIPETEISRLVAAGRSDLSRRLGVTISGNEKIEEAFYAAITSKIEDFFGPYRNFLPIAAAIIFFLAFKAFTWPLYFLAMLVTYLLIKLMALATIIKEEKVTIEVEKLVL